MWRNPRHLRMLFACLVLLAVVTAPAGGSVLGIVGVSTSGPCAEGAPIASGLGDPFGSLDGNGLTGGNGASGSVQLIGWALDDDGVAAVDILVDGWTVGRAAYGLRRADVSAVFPGFPDSALPGFQFQLDTTQWPNGRHQVSAVVVSKSGQSRPLNALGWDFSNNTHNLKPFGHIESPQRDAELFGVCDPLDPDRRYTVIEGWALDLGVENNDHGIGYVELLIDGVIHRNTRLDCRHSNVTGAYTDCYGKRRADIETQYPFAVDTPNAGYRFVIDVGSLVASGLAEGHHILTVRAGDVDSQVNNIDTANVNFICQDLTLDEGSLGGVDLVKARLSGGLIDLTGWALDSDGVASVRIFVDGRFIGIAAYGFPRPEITSEYPGFPDSTAPGWVFSLNTTQFSDGEHVATVLVLDDDGNDTLIGETRFQVVN